MNLTATVLVSVWAAGAVFFAWMFWRAWRAPGVLNHHRPDFAVTAAVCAVGWPIYLLVWSGERR